MSTVTSFASPIVTSVSIQDLFFYIYRGSTVTFGVEVRNNGVYQPQKLIDLAEPPTVTLYDPLSVKMFEDNSMTKIAIGKYGYKHKTKYSDPLGLYTAKFTTTYAGDVHIIEDVGIFYLRDASFAVFTYLPMIDAEGVVWFIWLDNALQVNVTRELPDVLRVPQALHPIPVAWLRVVSDDTMQPYRYLYVDVAGQLNVAYLEPITIPGYEDDLVFTATSGVQARLACDIADQVVVVPLE